MSHSLEYSYFKKAMHESGALIKSETQDEIVARCPICGDSRYRKNVARLHIYAKLGVPLINCFNGDCPVKNMTINRFLREFYPGLHRDYSRDKFRTNVYGKDVFAPDFKIPDADWIKEPELCLFDLSNTMQPLESSPEALEYVTNRGFTYQPSWKWFYCRDNLEINNKVYLTENSVVIPLYKGDLWYGFYSRNISKKSFATYIPERNSGMKIWNIFNIDKSKPVYIFEGIFDALSLLISGEPNVIACLGATVPKDVLATLTEPILCYDNDRTGITNMVKALKETNFKVNVLDFGSDSPKDLNELLQQGKELGQFVKDHIKSGPMAIISLSQRL